MIRYILLSILLILSTTASALDSTDVGTYAVVHKDGHVTNFTFFVSLDHGTWNVEQKNPDGSWQNVTCEQDCQLRESSAQDFQRFFPSKVLDELMPSCIHNTAFAFCNYALKSHPNGKGYIFIALVTPQPTPLGLKKLSNNR